MLGTWSALQPWLLEAAAVSAVLAILVAVGCRCLRLSAAFRHVLWLLVLLKLLVPTLGAWPRFEIPVIGSKPQVSVPTLPLEVTGGLPSDFRPLETWEAVAPSQPALIRPNWLAAALPYAVPLIWLLGACAYLAVLTRGCIQSAQRFRGATAAPTWLLELWDDAGTCLRTKLPPIRIVDGLATPLLHCAGRLTLYVPTDLLTSLPKERWLGILLHEAAHVRRGDPWVCRLHALAGVVWWWNPVYWWAGQRLRAEAELASDAWVASLSGAPADRTNYALTLVGVCEAMSLSPVSVAKSRSLPMPAVGLEMASAGRFLERRLTMILRGGDGAPRVSRFGLGVVLALAVLSVPSWSHALSAVLAQDVPPPASVPTAPTAPTAPIAPVEASRTAPPVSAAAPIDAAPAQASVETLPPPASAPVPVAPVPPLPTIAAPALLPPPALAPAAPSRSASPGSRAVERLSSVASSEVEAAEFEATLLQNQLQAHESAYKSQEARRDFAVGKVERLLALRKQGITPNLEVQAQLDLDAQLANLELESLRAKGSEIELRLQQAQKRIARMKQSTSGAARDWLTNPFRAPSANPIAPPMALAPSAAPVAATLGVSGRYGEVLSAMVPATLARAQDPRNDATVELLEKELDFAFTDELPLIEVLKHLREEAKKKHNAPLRIYLDPVAQVEGSVRLELEGVSIKTALRLILSQLQLSYIVRDGLVIISTSDRLEELDQEFRREVALPVPAGRPAKLPAARAVTPSADKPSIP